MLVGALSSPSSRRAWIEICCPGLLQAYYSVALLAEGVDRNAQVCEDRVIEIQVALLAEGVDRNSKKNCISLVRAVALLAEGVDRNIFGRLSPCTADVALLAEGVDRNCNVRVDACSSDESPSSRRAWIEIPPFDNPDFVY